MTEPILMGIIVLFFFTRSVFHRPKPDSKEKKLGNALTAYLEDGVKVKH
ncbi:MAG: hypothetical protein F6K31_42830 [Symploca sp. SIO2G7]|nr:hypothetical protein [Symploca sp. SIO2G7]